MLDGQGRHGAEVAAWMPVAVACSPDHGSHGWLLFLILIPLGVMNVAAMVAVAAVVFAEKVLPRARVVSALAATALIGIGLAVISRPSLLPTVA